jgi:hypothetical protein
MLISPLPPLAIACSLPLVSDKKSHEPDGLEAYGHKVTFFFGE